MSRSGSTRKPNERRMVVRVGVVAASLLVLGGCSNQPTAEDDELSEGEIPELTVPADAPKLVATTHQVPIRDKPSLSAALIGTLGLGAQVARSAEAYPTKSCPGGWLGLRPRGWVCSDEGVSIDLDHPAALLGTPDRGRALPYRYGRITRGAAVAYGSVPSAARQHEAEPKLGKLSRRDNDRLGVGANDVPLDDTAMPSGLPVLLPDAEGVADSGHRNEESWWVFPGDPPTLAEGTSLGGATDTRVLKRKSGVAIARSFVLGEGEAARRFGVTADGRVVPTDRMVAELGSIFHGVNADKDGLPIAFSLRRGVNAYELGDNATVTRTDDEFEPREAIPLTGRFRTVNRERFFFTRDEQWVRHNDVILIPKRHKFPSFATPEQKWLDVSLANQTLVAWHGHKPIYATLISSGSDRLGDPQTEAATIQGVFRLRSKHVARQVDDREVGQAYSVDSAPWVMEFHEGFSLVGCYWHTRFGEARSFHDIALSPIDAHMIWSWSGPEVPEGWLSRAIPEDAADNLIVYVHK